MYFERFSIGGLGCASYLVGCESAGVAAVIDPDRDVRKYLAAAEAHGVRITHILETHLHADHVSGNTDLAERTGARIYLHGGAQAEIEHEPLADGQVIRLGNVGLEARYTPGHTPDSVTLLVQDLTRGEAPWAALTGDTLMVGDMGRPDLVGREAARSLAADMHRTLFEGLAALPDGLLIYPGHGAGSLCARSMSAVPVSTLGYERQHNPALAPRPVDAFIDYATADLPEQPANHQAIKAANRRGPSPLGDVQPRPLTIQAAVPIFQRGAALLDLRPKAAFVDRHVPGAVHLEADAQLPNRIGFVLPADAPLVLLLADPADYERVVYSLARVGFDNVQGYLAESLDTWAAYGLPLTSGDVRDLTAEELIKMLAGPAGEQPVVLDVREPWEFAQGHVPGALLIPLGSLRDRAGELSPERPVAVICASGSRSQSAAALLAQRGFKTVYNVLGGFGAFRQLAAGIGKKQTV